RRTGSTSADSIARQPQTGESATMACQSRFVILGKNVFQSADGRSVRGAFDTSTASLYILPERLAGLLEEGSEELTAAQVKALSRAGLLAGPDAGESYLRALAAASADLTTRTFILMPTPAAGRS